MHAIRLKEPQPAPGEMQRQFGITLLAPGIGIKIVKKNNFLVESGKKERSVCPVQLTNPPETGDKIDIKIYPPHCPVIVLFQSLDE